jgi:hypothetical protein
MCGLAANFRGTQKNTTFHTCVQAQLSVLNETFNAMIFPFILTYSHVDVYLIAGDDSLPR